MFKVKKRRENKAKFFVGESYYLEKVMNTGDLIKQAVVIIFLVLFMTTE
jgi:hypothetical protein